ncbi:MAG: class I SAM-dependent methyltransferase [Bryobacter sp.]|jgi:ubiquinone/menaquinone biosynthesis C-methylase UbiE|nr:class I SAM-dependent methyltransferase [Bryobacter sp. CoA8 C33]
MTIAKQRVREQEILDQASDELAAQNLADIARINRLTGARARLLAELRRFFPIHQPFRFLDVGAASGDFATAVQRRFPQSTSLCVDLQLRNLRRAPSPKLSADAFSLPFRDASVDIAHCSLFLHHFSEEECRRIIAEMHRVCRRALIVQDLHRHWLSYYFLPATQPLLGWQKITVGDGMKSVAAGWRRHELEDIFSSYPARIRWHFPSFRYFITVPCRS